MSFVAFGLFWRSPCFRAGGLVISREPLSAQEQNRPDGPQGPIRNSRQEGGSATDEPEPRGKPWHAITPNSRSFAGEPFVVSMLWPTFGRPNLSKTVYGFVARHLGVTRAFLDDILRPGRNAKDGFPQEG